jgi:glutamine synthetase
MKNILEYIWLGGKYELRSKIKVVELSNPLLSLQDIKDIPAWNYDGSSTEQATGENSEMNLLPVGIYKNPLSKHNYPSFLIWCETRDKDNKPLGSNNRHSANLIFNQALQEEPWYGLEQEFFILNKEICDTLRKKTNGDEITQGQYYCSVGGKNAMLRHIVDKHMIACIDAGLNISGTNAEVAPYQWEFQIGPCTGIQAGDQLWVARYLLEKIAEEEGYYIDWSPKPFVKINGSGCHTNFSTQSMRQNGGLKVILNTITKLSLTHSEDMKHYGNDNDKRMSGLYETASFDTFSFDINKPVNRGASVRVGHDTVKEGKGYFEDRRPASNIDPYIVTSRLFSNYLN